MRHSTLYWYICAHSLFPLWHTCVFVLIISTLMHYTHALFYSILQGKDHHEGISLSNATAKTKTLQSQQPSILCYSAEMAMLLNAAFSFSFLQFFFQFPSALTSGIAARVWRGPIPRGAVCCHGDAVCGCHGDGGGLAALWLTPGAGMRMQRAPSSRWACSRCARSSAENKVGSLSKMSRVLVD